MAISAWSQPLPADQAFYFLEPDPELSTLQFQEYSAFVEAALEPRGYIRVPDPKAAEMRVFLYWNGQGVEETYEVPLIGPTGQASSFTTGSFDAATGAFYQNTFNVPEVGVIGTRSKTDTSFATMVALNAINVLGPEQWSAGMVLMTDKPGVRKYLPLALYGARDLLGENPGKDVTRTIREGLGYKEWASCARRRPHIGDASEAPARMVLTRIQHAGAIAEDWRTYRLIGVPESAATTLNIPTSSLESFEWLEAARYVEKALAENGRSRVSPEEEADVTVAVACGSATSQDLIAHIDGARCMVLTLLIAAGEVPGADSVAIQVAGTYGGLTREIGFLVYASKDLLTGNHPGTITRMISPSSNFRSWCSASEGDDL